MSGVCNGVTVFTIIRLSQQSDDFTNGMIWLQTLVLMIWSQSVLQLIEIAVQTDFIQAFDFFQNGHCNSLFTCRAFLGTSQC